MKPDTAIAIYVRLVLDDQTIFYVNRLWITVDHNMNAWFGWSNPFSNLNLARSCLILFLCFLFETLIWVWDVPTLWADSQTWMQTCQHQWSVSFKQTWNDLGCNLFNLCQCRLCHSFSCHQVMFGFKWVLSHPIFDFPHFVSMLTAHPEPPASLKLVDPISYIPHHAPRWAEPVSLRH